MTANTSEGPASESKASSCAKAWWDRSARALVALHLEVLGGAGAVWGGAEAFGVRDHTDNNTWRLISVVVGLVCFARWVDLFCLERSPNGHVGGLASFLLQVIGGAGALWGCVEIMGLRRNYPPDCHDVAKYGSVAHAWAPGYDHCSNTYGEFRIAALVLFSWFFVRWNPPTPGEWFFPGVPRWRRSWKLSDKVAAIFDSFVLEVMGAAGAVWGCAEVAGPQGHSLRLGWSDEGFGQETFDHWRIPCAVIFVLYLVRWVLVHVLPACCTSQDVPKVLEEEEGGADDEVEMAERAAKEAAAAERLDV